MKVIVTGSLGNISKPLAGELVEKGIEVLGARAVIGSIEDARRQGHELVPGGNYNYE